MRDRGDHDAAILVITMRGMRTTPLTTRSGARLETARTLLATRAIRGRSLARLVSLLTVVMTAGCTRHFVAEGLEDAGEIGEADGASDDEDFGPDGGESGRASDAAADVPSDAEAITEGGGGGDCVDHYFVVTSAHVLLESRDARTWSVALEDPSLGFALAATRDRAFVTGANGYGWSREDGAWNPSTLAEASVLTAAFEDELLVVTPDTTYVQRDGRWQSIDIDLDGGRPILLMEGPQPFLQYSDIERETWMIRAFDGTSWSPARVTPWTITAARLSSSSAHHVVVGPGGGDEVWRSVDGTSWSRVGPLNLFFDAVDGDYAQVEWQSNHRMVDEDVFAWCGFEVADFFLSSDPNFRTVVLRTSDFETWSVIPLGEWSSFAVRDEWTATGLQQMSDRRLLVGGRTPSGGALWIVDLEDETASLVASGLPGEVRSMAISRCN